MFNSSRTVENQTMVLFWLLIGLKFRVIWYINHYVLKKKVFHLIRGYNSDVMKPLQFFPKLLGGIPNGFFLQISCSYGGNQKIPLSDNNYGLPEISPYYPSLLKTMLHVISWKSCRVICSRIVHPIKVEKEKWTLCTFNKILSGPTPSRNEALP